MNLAVGVVGGRLQPSVARSSLRHLERCETYSPHTQELISARGKNIRCREPRR
jgi:hypothetical protein